MVLPEVLTNLSYDFLKSQDGYFIRIEIMKLNTHLDFPLTANTNEDGVRDFTNDMANQIVYIDKVGLEGLITFHEAEFEINDSCDLNEGRDEINNVTKNLYGLRLKLKPNSPAQVVTKVLMNSMYGETIIRPVETDTIMNDSRDDFETYVHLIRIVLIVC